MFAGHLIPHTMRRILFFGLMAVMFASCGSIEITKRRHMPGYHVDISKAKKQTAPDLAVAGPETAVPAVSGIDMTHIAPVAVGLVADEAEEAGPVMASSDGKFPLMALPKMSANVKAEVAAPAAVEVGKGRFGAELRKSVFPTAQEEKYGWSVLSFIGFGLGALAFILTFVGISFLIVFGPLWFLPMVLALTFGIAALIIGILGIKDASRNNRKGRGFAIAGVAAGGLSIFLSLILLLVGAILTVAGV
jgi:hypothetical protein